MASATSTERSGSTYSALSVTTGVDVNGNTVVGPYIRRESVGKGSFATVFKGIHPDDGTLVAIKTVNVGQLKGKLKANLFSEIDILQKIRHPHIVALIQIMESDRHMHLVMEFCQLGDMATFVKKRDKLSAHPVTADMMRKYPNPPGGGFNEVIARHFAQQLASALEFLRKRNLVHRDLKPQNLLLNPPPSWIELEEPENRPYQVSEKSLVPAAGIPSLPALKIADFGFARHLPQTTMAETLCGSPLYMAPEILRYEKYDAKADLWSVGTVLYELMAGRPPFRASNHVELLRRIEKANNKIKFPEDLEISSDMVQVIKALLQRMPTERISWEDFFQSPIIKNEIPGLVDSDRPTASLASDVNKQALRDETSSDQTINPATSAPSTPKAQSSTPMKRTGSEKRPTNSPTPSSNNALSQQRRPPLPSHATEPAVPGVRNGRLAAVGMEKKRSQDSHPNKNETEIERTAQTRERALKETRERAAQEVAFERDYVVVDRQQVEVNAFADELAASPRIHGGPRSPPSQAALIRRTASHGPPSSSAPPSTARNMQVAVRPDAIHSRKHSYERRYEQGRMSAQSALAAALNMVNVRLHGGPFAPSGRGTSPPQGYGPFPTFPVHPAGPLLINDNSKPVTMDEDQKVLNLIEESASRSDLVHGFAEVKYKQLVPIAPSSDNRMGIHRNGGVEGTSTETAGDDDGLTVDAIVGIAEEALVLYVKALAILTNTISLAGSWWAFKTKGEVLGEAGTARPSEAAKPNVAAVGSRINHVVQWARNRFNECLEKSEYVSRRLIDAQKKLPRDHPGHTRNRSNSLPTGGSSSITSEIYLTSGVTAEKLMYDRALDMSKTAAVNELVGEDLPGCKMSYSTAIRLLEAVLESDDESSRGKGLSKQRREKAESDETDAIEGIEESDRKTVLKLIEHMKVRLNTLQGKIDMQKASSRKSSTKTTSVPSEVGPARGSNPTALPMARTSSK